MASLNHTISSSSTFLKPPRITNIYPSSRVTDPLHLISSSRTRRSTSTISLKVKSQRLPQTKTLIPETLSESVSSSTKRPVCPKCSKPTKMCICNRFTTPPLNNSVNVTILQHNLEKTHHLNTTRIARIGLKNVDVVTVSDVDIQARFLIWLLDNENGQLDDEVRSTFVGDRRESEAFVVDLVRNSRSVEINFDQLLTPLDNTFVDDVRKKGFVVKKLQKRSLEGTGECEEIEEFEIVVPPGSVLLFPSEESVDVEAVNFEVNNLIVLDGTWSKAMRMYNENPWLRFLPHIRLDIEDKLSLYGEVRPQPKAGYLSTIESIVYTMKAVGEGDSEGLDGLLNVFESMVGDQRRCMNERLIREASI